MNKEVSLPQLFKLQQVEWEFWMNWAKKFSSTSSDLSKDDWAFPRSCLLAVSAMWVLYPGGILLPSKQNSGSSWWYLTQNWNKASSRLPKILSKILLLPRVLKVGKKQLPSTYSPQVKNICRWRKKKKSKFNSILEGKVREGWETSGTKAKAGSFRDQGLKQNLSVLGQPTSFLILPSTLLWGS